MWRNPFAHLSLLARYSLVSLFVTLLIAISLGWGLQYQLERNALWTQAENTADQVTTVLNKNLRASDLTAPLGATRYDEIDALIRSTLFSAHVVRVKVWNSDGLLVYSDERDLVGGQFPLSQELQKALGGQMSAEISKLDKPENISERLYTRLFEIYVPLQPADSTQVAGAYEIYYDPNTLAPRLARIRRFVWEGVGLGFLVLYAALFWLVRSASRELIRRNSEAKEQLIQRKKAEQERERLLLAEHEQRQLAEALGRVSLALSGELDLRRLLDLICRESINIFGVDAAFLWLIEGGDLVGFAAHGPSSDSFIGMRFPLYDPQLLGARVVRERKPLIVSNASASTEVNQQLVKLFETRSMLGVPLIRGQRVLGALMILDSKNPQRFQPKDLETASVLSSHAAIAIDNAQLYAETQRHLRHAQALRDVDRVITSSLDLQFTLEVVLKQALSQLHADASAILLLDAETQTLGYGNGLGFQRDEIKRTYIRVGEGIAGQAAAEQRTLSLPHIEEASDVPERAKLLTEENFAAYSVAPLIAKDKVLGVLEVFHCSPLVPSADWLNFFETLAGQAAVAIDNASLFTDLQRSNLELGLAYDATIEGWARALELRDKETEGHTRRVTEMTERLARAMGIGEEERAQIRRGALLHDIGKMAVADSILLKPDKLTKAELKVMQQHAQYAYDMLADIAYLREALDIPFCHHERWNGSGYPRGLKGKQIPLAARIFAVADVYDALTTDRPYHTAWTKNEALTYLRKQARKLFDPQVVKAFLKLQGES